MTDFLYDLFSGSFWGGAFWSAAVKVLVAFALLLVNTLLLIWFERKVVAWMQNRYGPRRAGPYGILQTLADGLKLFFKEQVTRRWSSASTCSPRSWRSSRRCSSSPSYRSGSRSPSPATGARSR